MRLVHTGLPEFPLHLLHQFEALIDVHDGAACLG